MDYDVEIHSGQNPSPPEQVSSEVTRILDAIRRTALSSPEEARPAALHLVTLLAPVAKGTTSIVRGGLAPWQKRKVDQHVRENLRRQLRVNELAEQVSLSASHFNRAFKETFGEPPHAYIVRLRLELAKKLILSTADTLSQIALACGFADQSHLSKVFRRGVGESPNAWRRGNLTEAQALGIHRPA